MSKLLFLSCVNVYVNVFIGVGTDCFLGICNNVLLFLFNIYFYCLKIVVFK